ncbi:MAG: AtpZ/AtpI family protein [Syntrophaceticus sp.]
MEKKKESTSVWKTLGLMTNIGVTLAAAVLIGYYMGYYLDQWIFGKTNYWLTIIFSLFGIAAGFRTIFNMINKTLDNDKGNGGNKE